MSKPVQFSTSSHHSFVQRVEEGSEKAFLASTTVLMTTVGVGVTGAFVGIASRGRVMPSMRFFNVWQKGMNVTSYGMISSVLVGGVANFARNSHQSPFVKKGP